MKIGLYIIIYLLFIYYQKGKKDYKYNYRNIGLEKSWKVGKNDLKNYFSRKLEEWTKK